MDNPPVSGMNELHLMVGPVVLGGGTPAFDGVPADAQLRLIDFRSWESSDNLLVRYDAPTVT